jgi:membrane-bound serine protease (ClpP class)
LWGLGVLEVNIVGIALVLLGAALIVAEIFTAGFGAFGVGGVVSLILGLMMVDKEPWIEVVGDMAKGVAIGIFVVFSISMVLARRAMKKPVSVGKETIIGQIGFAATDIKPDGMVKVKGELWRATSTEHIEKGEEIVVKDLKGLVLVIEKRKK